jgi:hypothetical protein
MYIEWDGGSLEDRRAVHKDRNSATKFGREFPRGDLVAQALSA